MWGYVRRGRFVKICRKIDGAMSGVLVALLVLGYNSLSDKERRDGTFSKWFFNYKILL